MSQIINSIINGISHCISKISALKGIFSSHTNYYNLILSGAGYKDKLEYTNSLNDKQQSGATNNKPLNKLKNNSFNTEWSKKIIDLKLNKITETKPVNQISTTVINLISPNII